MLCLFCILQCSPRLLALAGLSVPAGDILQSIIARSCCDQKSWVIYICRQYECIHTYIHTHMNMECIQAHMHTCAHTFKYHTGAHAYTHECIQAHMHTHIHTYMHMATLACMCAVKCEHTWHMHTHIHAHGNACMAHAYTHTYINSYTCFLFYDDASKTAVCALNPAV